MKSNQNYNYLNLIVDNTTFINILKINFYLKLIAKIDLLTISTV